MLKCSYVVFIFNNEDNITQLVDSLQKINGNFYREFIFIDNGSSDNSLFLLKQNTLFLPKSTVILHQNFDPSFGFSKILNLLTGDYVHFVDGSEILKPDSTVKLLNLCKNTRAEVAIGTNRTDNQTHNIAKITVKESPIKEILENSLAGVRNVGLCSSLVETRLLEKIDYTNETLYFRGIYLSLKCAQYANFVITDEVISITNKINVENEQLILEQYNNLQMILSFTKQNLHFCEKYKNNLILALSREISDPLKKVRYYFRYAFFKFSKNLSLSNVIEYYQKELAKLM